MESAPEVVLINHLSLIPIAQSARYIRRFYERETLIHYPTTLRPQCHMASAAQHPEPDPSDLARLARIVHDLFPIGKCIFVAVHQRWLVNAAATTASASGPCGRVRLQQRQWSRSNGNGRGDKGESPCGRAVGPPTTSCLGWSGS